MYFHNLLSAEAGEFFLAGRQQGSRPLSLLASPQTWEGGWGLKRKFIAVRCCLSSRVPRAGWAPGLVYSLATKKTVIGMSVSPNEADKTPYEHVAEIVEAKAENCHAEIA